MNCKECFNFTGETCETMTAPFNDMSCFMTKEMRLTAEEEALANARLTGNETNIRDIRKTIRELRGRI